MANRGLGLYLDPQVRTHHWNCSRMLPTLLFAWYFSREFAAYRIRHMTLLQRAKLALLWPLIPIVRLKRIWPCMASFLGYPRTMAALPAVALNLFVSGAAEGFGYATGKVGDPQKCLDWEFHRERFLRRGEQLVLRAVPGESAVSTSPVHRPARLGTTSTIDMRSNRETEVQST